MCSGEGSARSNPQTGKRSNQRNKKSRLARTRNPRNRKSARSNAVANTLRAASFRRKELKIGMSLRTRLWTERKSSSARVAACGGAPVTRRNSCIAGKKSEHRTVFRHVLRKYRNHTGIGWHEAKQMQEDSTNTPTRSEIVMTANPQAAQASAISETLQKHKTSEIERLWQTCGRNGTTVKSGAFGPRPFPEVS